MIRFLSVFGKKISCSIEREIFYHFLAEEYVAKLRPFAYSASNAED